VRRRAREDIEYGSHTRKAQMKRETLPRARDDRIPKGSPPYSRQNRAMEPSRTLVARRWGHRVTPINVKVVRILVVVQKGKKHNA
jgi:hypothetical protein